MRYADPYGASKAIRPWEGTSLSTLGRVPKLRTLPPGYLDGVRSCLSCPLPPETCDNCRGPTSPRRRRAGEKGDGICSEY